jgi:hypothetical protein
VASNAQMTEKELQMAERAKIQEMGRQLMMKHGATPTKNQKKALKKKRTKAAKREQGLA